jgi:ABC-type dipeptide/oligopeptide/nickel transport system permease component
MATQAPAVAPAVGAPAVPVRRARRRRVTFKRYRRYLAKRLGASLVTLLGVTLTIFLIMRAMPGDPGRVIAGFNATGEQVQQVRLQLGLDKPLPVQYGLFLAGIVQGDLGRSAQSGQPVTQLIFEHLPYTLELALVAIVLGSLAGVGLGVLAAVRRNSIVDYLVSTVAVLGVSMPVYWLGLLLIILFAIRLGLLPAAGAQEPLGIVMPALSVAAFLMALESRITRGTMLDVLHQDYIRTARAKGLSPAVVVLKHGLRNAALPVVTVIGLQLGSLMGGAVLTETVFGWPGIGRLLVDSIFARDLPVVQGVVLVFATSFILINLAVDFLYLYLDPRVKY